MNIKRIIDAYEFAKEAHAGQKRKNTGEPYINHPVAVADIAKEISNREDMLIACLLHDVVENTPVRLEDIKEEFGSCVAFLVDGVTKEKTPEKTLEKVAKYSKKDSGVILIKLADRIHNTSTIFRSAIEKYKTWNPEYARLGRKYDYNVLSDRLMNLTKKL